MKFKYEHMVLAGAVVLLAAAYTNNAAAAPAAPAEAGAALAALATNWVDVSVVPTPAGPRVCAPRGTPGGGKSSECKGLPLVTVGEYFEHVAKRCPGLVPVSATPMRVGSTGVHRVFVLGYRMAAGAPACPAAAFDNEP